MNDRPLLRWLFFLICEIDMEITIQWLRFGVCNHINQKNHSSDNFQLKKHFSCVYPKFYLFFLECEDYLLHLSYLIKHEMATDYSIFSYSDISSPVSDQMHSFPDFINLAWRGVNSLFSPSYSICLKYYYAAIWFCLVAAFLFHIILFII
jgi:hypothetical protein